MSRSARSSRHTGRGDRRAQDARRCNARRDSGHKRTLCMEYPLDPRCPFRRLSAAMNAEICSQCGGAFGERANLEKQATTLNADRRALWCNIQSCCLCTCAVTRDGDHARRVTAHRSEWFSRFGTSKTFARNSAKGRKPAERASERATEKGRRSDNLVVRATCAVPTLPFLLPVSGLRALLVAHCLAVRGRS